MREEGDTRLELLVDQDAPDERRIVITDVFGQQVKMSVEQLRVLVEGIRFGVLDLIDPDCAIVG